MKFTLNRIDRKNERHYRVWKNFLKDANGATIFHDPDFLAYHGDKFIEHHLAIYKGETLYGIIPMAIIDNGGEKIVKSPYGASYGGFIFRKVVNYSDAKKIVELFLSYIKKMGIKKIFITPSLPIYYMKGYSDTFLLAMLELGFEIYNSDISSVVFLNEKDIENNIFTSKSRNMARKARKAGVVTKFNVSLDDFWILMDKTFERHATNPTHSKYEIKYLMEQFSDKIYCNIAYLDAMPVAGVGVFELNEKNMMSFYLCSDIDYKQIQAMSLIIYDTLLKAKDEGFLYFDFGTSSVNMKGRKNIFRFKESFGAVGIFRHTYYWEVND